VRDKEKTKENCIHEIDNAKSFENKRLTKNFDILSINNDNSSFGQLKKISKRIR
jgi:hypothetical protein